MNWRRSIPNGLTILRLLMAPVFPFVPASWRLPMLSIGLATEYFDGFLARRWDGASAFGRVLDPIADKFFVLAAMLTLVREGYTGAVVMSLVMFRDIVVVLAALWFFASGGKRDQMPSVEPTTLGKVTTAVQIFFLIAVLVLERSPMLLLIPTVSLSLWSAWDYLRRYRDVLVPSTRA